MGIVEVKLIQPNIELQNQLDKYIGESGETRTIIEDYLTSRGISSLSEISIYDLNDYRECISSLHFFKKRMSIYRSSLLETITFAYQIDNNASLCNDSKLISEKAIRNKVIGFLLVLGVEKTEDINYEIRYSFEKYLEATIHSGKKVKEYVKALDKLKLDSIKRIEKPFGDNTLQYSNTKVFLLYYPSYELAMSFYYLRDKEELVFDFTIDTSSILKRQIFKMLIHILENTLPRHDRRERFLIPLKQLYLFCVENQISDIEELTELQIKTFEKYLINKFNNTLTDSYMQIIYNTQKYLFVQAQKTNWNAGVWYLERFNFVEGRTNPAREVKTFSFNEIVNDENQLFFKEYMKYRLGISQRLSIQTIRTEYYAVHSFLLYLDSKALCVSKMTISDFEDYIETLNLKDIKAESFNRAIVPISKFCAYLLSKKRIDKMPFNLAYYIKKSFLSHNDRTVSINVQLEILKSLKYYPYHLRLMYLNLCFIGLRVSEVCAIKGGSYIWDGQTAWIKIYQNKMKSEKMVPIPEMIYKLMKKYISENEIKVDEYVFKNRKGNAYDAGTFCKQFKRILGELGITDYSFKSHDFRHTVATSMYTNNTSIETIRDYLGHKDSDMTKQYIDYMENNISNANDKYFESDDNKLNKRKKDD